MSRQLSYCGQVVKAHDADRFLLSMFAPSAVREDVWALFAFNHEIAKTREVVTETQLGLIRLQWWREEIGKIYDGQGCADNEILQTLQRVISTHNLSQERFETLIYGREFDLEDKLPETMDGLLHYADYTATPLMEMGVQICGGDPAIEPVYQVAVNYALVGLLRAVVAHARQRRCYLPEAALKEQGVAINQLYELKPNLEGLAHVVNEVLDHIVQDLSPQNRFLKAAQALSIIYTKQLRGLDGNVFTQKSLNDPYFKALRLCFKVNI